VGEAYSEMFMLGLDADMHGIRIIAVVELNAHHLAPTEKHL
jgi:hypothetical protein